MVLNKTYKVLSQFSFELPYYLEEFDDPVLNEGMDFEEVTNELEQFLEQRISYEELEARNILKGRGVAPRLQAIQEEIRKKKLTEALQRKLEHRPSRERLVDQNIIKDTNLSSCLQSAQQQLKFSKTQQQLGFKLDHRPARDTLVEHNIIRGGVAPCLQAAQQSLKFQRTSIRLECKLMLRPDASVLFEHNILLSSAGVSSNLLSTQRSLKFHVVQAQLDHKLEHRPEPAFLLEQNIMHVLCDNELDDVNRFQSTASQLQNKLENRVPLSNLLSHGLLLDTRKIARSLQAIQVELTHKGLVPFVVAEPAVLSVSPSVSIPIVN